MVKEMRCHACDVRVVCAIVCRSLLVSLNTTLYYYYYLFYYGLSLIILLGITGKGVEGSFYH